MFDAPEPPNMELDTRIERLEMILFSRQELTGWVKADTAAKIVGVSARKLVAMYDQGKLPTAADRQINESTQRRRLVFDVELVKRSIGGPVLS